MGWWISLYRHTALHAERAWKYLETDGCVTSGEEQTGAHLTALVQAVDRFRGKVLPCIRLISINPC